MARAALAGLPFALAGAAAAFYGTASIVRNDRFSSGAYDLGIFDQTIWGYSRLEIVHNTVKGTPDLLGDHFHPALMLLAPAYWVWDDVRVLLVAQALLLAAASLPVYFWGRARLGRPAALFAQAGFLAFWGLLAGMIFDFHELALAVPAISFGLWALLERRRRLFWAMLVLGCLAKEDVTLTFAAMGVYALLVQRRVRFGLSVVVVTTAWFVTVLGLVIPAISGRRYHYFDYPALGSGWTAALLTLVERPYRAVTLALDRRTKVVTLLETFGAWCFLPLVSPLLLVALPTLAERFWAHNPAFWSTRYQYSLPLAPVLAFAAIDAVARLPRRSVPLLTAAAACGLALTVFVVRPLEGLTTLMSANEAAASDACLDRVPAHATVAASSILVPHLTHRSDVTLLSRADGQAYLAVAGRAADPSGYRRVCHRGDVTVMRRS
jgi:uncharacterized membrane protein